MPVSDEELQAKRERVESLRVQLVEQQQSNSAAVTEATNDVAAAQLDAEAARLESQLTEAQEVAERHEESADAQVASVANPEVVPDQGALDSLRAGEERNERLAREAAQGSGQAAPPVPPSTPTSVPTSTPTTAPVSTSAPSSQGEQPGGGQ